jgi:pimeloyl-ACP methyl ester carboxylesterase
VTGHALDCGHFIAEERPAELLEVLQPFLRTARSRD